MTNSTGTSSVSDAPHLVIGASGQVGEHLMHALRERELRAIGTYNRHAVEGMEALDVRDAIRVDELIGNFQPPVIYVPASLTHVDWCEQNADESFEINVRGVWNVVRAANRIGARVVYFSSDYIFDGRGGPYEEDEPGRPLCEYGRQKLAAEHIAALQSPGSLIVRTTVVYGWERQNKNFIQRLRDTVGPGQTLRAPVDQIGSPTYAPDLARMVVDLAQSECSGVYNVAGSELIDRVEFAREAARVFGLDEGLIEAVETRALGQPAARPLRAGMRVDKVAAKLGRRPLGYRDGLRQMKRDGEAREAREQAQTHQAL